MVSVVSPPVNLPTKAQELGLSGETRPGIATVAFEATDCDGEPQFYRAGFATQVTVQSLAAESLGTYERIDTRVLGAGLSARRLGETGGRNRIHVRR